MGRTVMTVAVSCCLLQSFVITSVLKDSLKPSLTGLALQVFVQNLGKVGCNGAFDLISPGSSSRSSQLQLVGAYGTLVLPCSFSS